MIQYSDLTVAKGGSHKVGLFGPVVSQALVLDHKASWCKYLYYQEDNLQRKKKKIFKLTYLEECVSEERERGDLQLKQGMKLCFCFHLAIEMYNLYCPQSVLPFSGRCGE